MPTKPNAELKPSDPRLLQACDDLARRPLRGLSGDGEDASQEACLRALELAEPNAVRDPIHYVVRIAKNLLVDRQRRRGTEARLFEPLSEEGASAGSDVIDPERILGGKQALKAILADIDVLPPRCREAFRLHRFENLSYVAIGHRMGISVSAVEKHIAEAMARLWRAHKARAGQS